MKNIQKGSLITDENENKYYVLNIVQYENRDYAICVEYDDPEKVIILEYRYMQNQLRLRKETDEEKKQLILIYSIGEKIL